jgi:urea carboxylase-associated protein 2
MAEEALLWEDQRPGGAHWSGIVRRGITLRLTDLAGGANCSAVFFNREEKLERYNMADTLKAQHTARLTRGHACYSDMGRVLCSITADSVGWHDPLCAPSDAAAIRARYGEKPYQGARNDMLRNARDGLLIELGKWGLSKRDLADSVNFFSKVRVDDAGELHFVAGHSRPGGRVELRFEMDCLVALSAAPHALDPRPDYAPGPVGLLAWRSGPAGPDDECRLSCAENERGFRITDMYYR